MSSRIQISDLDFDLIKTNLKNFLKQQSEFVDYDFEGSGMNVLLDILAYNTHYNSYFLNMAVNESFLDSAIVRDSVVSHAKSLGYLPSSIKSSIAKIQLIVDSGNEDSDEITLPRGYVFRSGLIDGISYPFTTIKDYTVEKNQGNNEFIFNNVEIYQGKFITQQFSFDESENPKRTFTITNKNIDISTISVQVDDENYILCDDIISADENSKIFFLQETRNFNYEIYFGDGNIGKKIDDDSIITVTYVSGDGPLTNGINRFTGMQTIDGYSNFTINVLSNAAGGADRESINSIKIAAPLNYSSQNRLVTLKDYEFYIKNKYKTIESISVWGGEENIPKVFGKVFVSIKPKLNYYISENEKQKIIDEIIAPKSIVSVKTEIVDPQYLYIKFTGKISFDKKNTSYTKGQIENLTKSTIINYANENLNTFESVFVLSKMEESVNKIDKSILGSQFKLKIEKRFEPRFKVFSPYNINFENSLTRGSLKNYIYSTEFYTLDKNLIERKVFIREVPYSHTGIDKIEILNTGFGYTTTPEIIISGDGNGATAVAKIVNGRLVDIILTNRGINYTQATVTISGGNGNLAEAVCNLDSRIGTLELIYYNSLAIKIIVDKEIGKIDYETGNITLKNLFVQRLENGFEEIKMLAEPENQILKSKRNQIITIDSTDYSTFSIVAESE